jgi:hypothetical protein
MQEQLDASKDVALGVNLEKAVYFLQNLPWTLSVA